MDWTTRSDEELAREVLRRSGEGGYREREARVPVSREVLRKFDGGDLSMRGDVRKRVLDWLAGRVSGPTYQDAALEAVQIVEDALHRLRQMAGSTSQAAGSDALASERAGKAKTSERGRKEASGGGSSGDPQGRESA